ncbi:hypothetical protein V8F20_008255 [Naviculisporaceae sp. PSN 640]
MILPVPRTSTLAFASLLLLLLLPPPPLLKDPQYLQVNSLATHCTGQALPRRPSAADCLQRVDIASSPGQGPPKQITGLFHSSLVPWSELKDHQATGIPSVWLPINEARSANPPKDRGIQSNNYRRGLRWMVDQLGARIESVRESASNNASGWGRKRKVWGSQGQPGQDSKGWGTRSKLENPFTCRTVLTRTSNPTTSGDSQLCVFGSDTWLIGPGELSPGRVVDFWLSITQFSSIRKPVSSQDESSAPKGMVVEKWEHIVNHEDPWSPGILVTPTKPCGANLHDVVHLTVLLVWWCSEQCCAASRALENGSPKRSLPMVVSPAIRGQFVAASRALTSRGGIPSLVRYGGQLTEDCNLWATGWNRAPSSVIRMWNFGASPTPLNSNWARSFGYRAFEQHTLDDEAVPPLLSHEDDFEGCVLLALLAEQRVIPGANGKNGGT